MSFLFFHLWLPPQTFSNSSIAICFVQAFSEFFVIILFFLIVILLFLSCRSGARCSDWHVQRYGRFLSRARIRATFAIGCCDSRTISRQLALKALWRVASSYLLILQVDFFQITGDRHSGVSHGEIAFAAKSQSYRSFFHKKCIKFQKYLYLCTCELIT